MNKNLQITNQGKQGAPDTNNFVYELVIIIGKLLDYKCKSQTQLQKFSNNFKLI